MHGGTKPACSLNIEASHTSGVLSGLRGFGSAGGEGKTVGNRDGICVVCQHGGPLLVFLSCVSTPVNGKT